jgi:hypothetical protein
MKNLMKITLFLAVAALAFGQSATTNTTLSADITSNQIQVCLASATGITTQSITASATYIVVESEAMQAIQAGSSSTCFQMRRGTLGTQATSHVNGAVAWVANTATSTGDSSRPFSGGAIIGFRPTGTCNPKLQATLPLILIGQNQGSGTGQVITCASVTTAGTSGRWGLVRSFIVPPTQCTFAPTTLTTTNTYIQVGTSTAFVLNGLSNAAAGTNTLVCLLSVPSTQTTSGQGVFLLDANLFVGSQTTAPTSLGTATFGTIAMPAAATTETASTVLPVAAGGTITTTSPTLITTVTTAGSFLTIKHTFGTAIRLSADRTLVQYTMPFLQSAAAAMALNTPGIQVHYLEVETN